MLTVRPLAHDRIEEVAARICAADMAELDAAGITDAKGMLREAVPWCAWADEALWNGETVAVFGVRPLAGQYSVGIPWMLCMPTIEAAGRQSVARQALREVSRMQEQFDILANYVHRENRRAIQLVQWLGFNVYSQPVGPGGNFYAFRWQRV